MIILPPVVCDVHFQSKGYHHFKCCNGPWSIVALTLCLWFFYRKAIHLPMSISGSYASNSMLHITSYRWPKRNLNKSDVSAPIKAWNTRRWLSAWMKLRWKSRRVNFYDASYTTPSWYVPFEVIKPPEHIRGCLIWLTFCCLPLCTTQICKVEIYVHPQIHLKKPWSIPEVLKLI